MAQGARQDGFHEIQKLRQWHIRIVLAVPPAALIFMSIRQIVFHHPWGHPPMTNGGLLFLTILLVLVYVRLITVRLATDMNSHELAVGLRGLWRRRRIPLSRIRSATAVTYDPVAEFGGYGIRSSGRGAAYIASGNRAPAATDRDRLLSDQVRAGCVVFLADKLDQLAGIGEAAACGDPRHKPFPENRFNGAAIN